MLLFLPKIHCFQHFRQVRNISYDIYEDNHFIAFINIVVLELEISYQT